MNRDGHSLQAGDCPENVFWIGGSPCCGKSAVARRMADRYDLRVYSCDDAYSAHLERARPDRHPVMSLVREMSWDEIWMAPVETLVEREIAFYVEEFEMIVSDLRSLPSSPPVLAEGAALLPERVLSRRVDPHHATWVVPTGEFQRFHTPGGRGFGTY